MYKKSHAEILLRVWQYSEEKKSTENANHIISIVLPNSNYDWYRKIFKNLGWNLRLSITIWKKDESFCQVLFFNLNCNSPNVLNTNPCSNVGPNIQKIGTNNSSRYISSLLVWGIWSYSCRKFNSISVYEI